jgi:hypothetical protein
MSMTEDYRLCLDHRLSGAGDRVLASSGKTFSPRPGTGPKFWRLLSTAPLQSTHPSLTPWFIRGGNPVRRRRQRPHQHQPPHPRPSLSSGKSSPPCVPELRRHLPLRQPSAHHPSDPPLQATTLSRTRTSRGRPTPPTAIVVRSAKNPTLIERQIQHGTRRIVLRRWSSTLPKSLQTCSYH